ncbi:hypothetical protein [Alcanivorax sp.]|uniref:hypothetical protein n=1 Tax=Alcanivorax sp. TaxID=1872427 RepID=UPI003A95AE47
MAIELFGSVAVASLRIMSKKDMSNRSTEYAVMRKEPGGGAMANNWNIPADLEQEVRERDRVCVYCRNEFLSHKESAKASASWEHIINDASIITRENICLCCRGCNASKGQKKLSDWLLTNYCKERGITADTVAPIIKQAIENGQ